MEQEKPFQQMSVRSKSINYIEEIIGETLHDNEASSNFNGSKYHFKLLSK